MDDITALRSKARCLRKQVYREMALYDPYKDNSHFINLIREMNSAEGQLYRAEQAALRMVTEIIES